MQQSGASASQYDILRNDYEDIIFIYWDILWISSFKSVKCYSIWYFNKTLTVMEYIP